MKILSLIVLIAFQPWILKAQDVTTNATNSNKIYKYEIGLSLLGLQTINSTHRSSSENSKIQLFNGVMFKTHYAANVLRFGLGYYEGTSTYTLGSSSSPGWYSHEDYFSQSLELRAGYERNFKFNHLTLYGAVDIISLFEYYKSTYVWSGGDFPPYGGSEAYTGSIMNFGIVPAIGLRYRFSRSFSASMESNITFLKGTKSGSNTEFYFYPVKFLQLNYHW